MLYQEQNSAFGRFFECIRYADFFFVPHIHRHPELIYVESGEVEVDLGSRVETVSEGEYALIFSNCRHGYRTPCHSTVYVCIFSEDTVPLFSRAIKGKQPDSIRFQCRQSVTDYARRELFVQDTVPDYYILKSVLYGVLGEFLETVHLTDNIGENDELVDKMIRYVTVNYTSPITLDTLAKELGYEKHYLSRCFNSKIKTGFTEYVNWYRVDHAENLLIHSDLSVADIGLQSGFGTIRSFNRVFLQHTGVTPRRFAEMNRIL